MSLKYSLFILSLIIVSICQCKTTSDIDVDDDSKAWMSVKMPKKSYFMGFEPPDDPERWEIAKRQARDGKFVLLPKIIEQIPNPDDIVDGDIAFRWIHRMGDLFLTTEKNPKGTGTAQELLDNYNKDDTSKIPLVLFGYRTFEHEATHSGGWRHFHSYTAENVLKTMKSGE